MIKISSDVATSLSKAYLILPLAVLLLILVVTISGALQGRTDSMVALIIVIPLFVLFVCYGKKFIWSLADEVYDDGDALVVNRGRLQKRILLADIEDLIDRTFTRTPVIIIKFIAECEFGDGIGFMPINSGNTFKMRSEIFLNLRPRIRMAKEEKILVK